MQRKWCNVELQKEDANKFKNYLRGQGITFEPSECYNLIHFECLMTDHEMESTNKWIDEELRAS